MSFSDLFSTTNVQLLLIIELKKAHAIFVLHGFCMNEGKANLAQNQHPSIILPFNYAKIH